MKGTRLVGNLPTSLRISPPFFLFSLIIWLVVHPSTALQQIPIAGEENLFLSKRDIPIFSQISLDSPPPSSGRKSGLDPHFPRLMAFVGFSLMVKF
jgi:hypothetical protein